MDMHKLAGNHLPKVAFKIWLEFVWEEAGVMFFKRVKRIADAETPLINEKQIP